MCRITAAGMMLGVAATIFAGCDKMGLAPQNEAHPANTEPARAGDASAVRPLVKADDVQGRSAIDEALDWAQKYRDATERYSQLVQENKKLAQDNQKLQEQATQLRFEAAQAQGELAKANTMLVEMRGELNKWQSNVLGFRKEMLEAEQTEIVALNRILKIMAGEPVPMPATQPTSLPATEPAPVAKEATSAPAH